MGYGSRAAARVSFRALIFRKPLAIFLLVAIGAVACKTPSQTSSVTAARPASNFGAHLSLSMSLGNALRSGDRIVAANFALKNDGASTFEGCFGPSWGVSVIVGGVDAGQIVRSDHPTCEEKLTLLPGQTIVWSKKVPLSNLRSGAAKVTGWVKVLDPAACGQRTGCREISIPSPSTTVTVGER